MCEADLLLDPDVTRGNQIDNVEIVRHGALGVQVVTSPGLVSAVIVSEIRAGTYEIFEALAAQQVVDDNDCVLELGGGLGVVAAFVCKVCRPRRYEVIEADPRLLPYLVATLELNGSKEPAVHNLVLTDESNALRRGSIELSVMEDFWLSTTLPMDQRIAAVSVAVSSFSAFLDRLKPTVLICDIEGAEHDLFDTSNMDSVSALILELHPDAIGFDGCQGVLDRLSSIGFEQTSPSVGSVVVLHRR